MDWYTKLCWEKDRLVYKALLRERYIDIQGFVKGKIDWYTKLCWGKDRLVYKALLRER